MPQIDTKLGLIDAKYLDLRITAIDDAKRFGSRIEVWPKPAAELAQMAWEPGDEGHPNCGRGDVQSSKFLLDTLDPVTHAMGPGTMIVVREEFHPPNCVVAKLALCQREEPLAVYEQVDWEKVNPFEDTPVEVSADFGDGKGIVTTPTAALTKKVLHLENDNEYTHAVEYSDATGKIVHRSADVKLKRSGVVGTGAAASFS